MQHPLKFASAVVPANRKLGFIEWMDYINNVHRANPSLMDGAIANLIMYDYIKAVQQDDDDDDDEAAAIERMLIIMQNGNTGEHYDLLDGE